MPPVDLSNVSDLFIWSEIQYLDPDFETSTGHRLVIKTGQSRRRKLLIVALIALAALAGALALGHLPVLSKLIN